MEDLDAALRRLATSKVDHGLDGLEADVWRAVAELEGARRRAALIRPVGAAGVIGSLLLGVAAGGAANGSVQTAELEVFSSRPSIAPSTLLGGAG